MLVEGFSFETKFLMDSVEGKKRDGLLFYIGPRVEVASGLFFVLGIKNGVLIAYYNRSLSATSQCSTYTVSDSNVLSDQNYSVEYKISELGTENNLKITFNGKTKKYDSFASDIISLLFTNNLQVTVFIGGAPKSIEKFCDHLQVFSHFGTFKGLMRTPRLNQQELLFFKKQKAESWAANFAEEAPFVRPGAVQDDVCNTACSKRGECTAIFFNRFK